MNVFLIVENDIWSLWLKFFSPASKISIQVMECQFYSNKNAALCGIFLFYDSMLGNVKLGYFLLLIHILSALITSLLLKPISPLSLTRSIQQASAPSSKTLPTLFNEAVAQSMDTMTCIGGYIIFFSVLSHVITDTKLLHWFFKLPLINRLAPQLSQAIITSFLELSNGVNALSHTASPYTLALLAAALAFGGLCVYFQTLYVLGDVPFSTKPYFLSKCLQAIISFLLTCMIYPLCPHKECSLHNYTLISSIYTLSPLITSSEELSP